MSDLDAVRRHEALALAVQAHADQPDTVSHEQDRDARIVATARVFEAYLSGAEPKDDEKHGTFCEPDCDCYPQEPEQLCGAIYIDPRGGDRPQQPPCGKALGHEHGPETDWKRGFHSNGTWKWPVEGGA